MSTYEQAILRTNVEDRLPDEVASTVITGAAQHSAVLSAFRRVNLSNKTLRLPVQTALPTAYFVDGDTGLKQTTSVEWDKVVLTAEELAVIVPIPEAVLEDGTFDVWGEISPLLEEVVGIAIDAAAFAGTNKPASWPTALFDQIDSHGNTFELQTNDASEGGLAADLADLMSIVEDDGYEVTHFVAPKTFKARLRGARDTTGQKLLDVSTQSIDGVPIIYAGAPDLWDSDHMLLAGDFTKAVCGVRKDFTYKLLDQAVISDDSGNIVYNLAQQDMVALRLVFRVAVQFANPVTHEAGTSGLPFALLTNHS